MFDIGDRIRILKYGDPDVLDERHPTEGTIIDYMPGYPYPYRVQLDIPWPSTDNVLCLSWEMEKIDE